MFDNGIFRKLSVVSLIILAIPLLGTLLTDQFDWTFTDFFVVGLLLLGFNVTISLVFKNIKDKTVRWVVVAIAIIVLILFWMELAVGVFNSPFAGS